MTFLSHPKLSIKYCCDVKVILAAFLYNHSGVLFKASLKEATVIFNTSALESIKIGL